MIFIFYIVLYLISLIGIFSIAFLVHRSSRTLQNRYFALFATFVSTWLSLQLLSQLFNGHPQLAIVLLRIAVSFAPLIGVEFLLFAQEYTNTKVVNSKYLFVIPAIVLAVGWSPNLVIRVADINRYGIAIQQTGWLYPIVLLFAIVFFSRGLYLIVKDLIKHRADHDRTSRSKLLVYGFIQMVIVAVGGSIFLSSSVISQILIPISALIMASLVAYAIVKHQLFDVRLIIARALAYVLVIFTASALFSIIVFGLLSRFMPVNNGVSRLQQIPYLITALLIAYALQPLRSFFDKITNRIFYRDGYDTEVVINQLGSLFALEIDISVIAHKSLDIICKEMKLMHGRLAIINDNQQLRITTYGDAPKEPIDNSVFKGTKGKVLSVDSDELSVAKRQELRALNIDIIVRLVTQDGPVGYLLLGPKLSGNPYSSQDNAMLSIISNEMAVAVQNSLLFERISKFNVTLQEKVDEATRKLRRANEKLKALDETKDDFISMASHQLRTPLTSIKGYISMVLEGDAGKVSPMQHEMLGQAFFSSQRMVYLISDLLNVSRLKTGKFVIERSKVNLATMVAQELDQLKETAAARKLTLTHDNPDDFPDLMLDETKTRQVIMNFVDNAIYYTPAGGHINVRLIDNPNSVELRVEDDGIGVSKTDQPHLFTKFYRAGNARKARPDGTGLGLFMAKKVIIAEEGNLIFESTEGKGSTFGFVFYKSKAGVAK